MMNFSVLFKEVEIKVTDYDKIIDEVLGRRQILLMDFIKQNFHIRPIQIFHYAVVKFSKVKRMHIVNFLACWAMFFGDFEIKDKKLYIRSNFGSELEGIASEILALGLATMFMCRWFEIKVSIIKTITNTDAKKRMDCIFFHSGHRIAYEAKGRQNINKLQSAIKDSKEKKEQGMVSANEKYAIVAYLPRMGKEDAPVELILADPPVSEKKYPDETYENIAKHYENITRLIGLYDLSNAIGQKMTSDIKDKSPILETLNLEGVETKTVDFSNETHIFYFKKNFVPDSTLFLERFIGLCPFNINLKSVRFQLGIDKKIVDNLMKWNIKKLLEDEYDEWSDLEKGISIISDGTILWLKYT